MPPSERATRRSYSCTALRFSQSAAELTMEIGMVVIHASIGVFIDACGAEAPVPIWMLMAMSWSAQACHIGFQKSSWMLGMPLTLGLSEKVTAWQPFLA